MPLVAVREVRPATAVPFTVLLRHRHIVVSCMDPRVTAKLMLTH